MDSQSSVGPGEGKNAPVVTRIDSIDEPPQLLFLLGILLLQLSPKRHNIYSYVVLLELLAEPDERVGRSCSLCEGRADKDDDPLPLVLILPVFESKLASKNGQSKVHR
jgi:hypothetical protein